MKFWSNGDIPSHGTFVPEKRLLAAVLQRAITDFISGDGELKEGARLWLLEDESCADAPLSFRFICEALDLDLSSLRKAIFMQEEAQTAATAAASAEAASAERVLVRASVQALAINPIVGGSQGASIVSASRPVPSIAAASSVVAPAVASMMFQEAAL
jgi:hypothetical protein